MINEQEINTRNLHISQTDKLVAAVIIINNTREITIIITVNLVIIGDNIYIYIIISVKWSSMIKFPYKSYLIL